MSCSVCKFSEVYEGGEANSLTPDNVRYQCKRFPPTPIPVPTFDRMTNQQGIGIQPVFPIMRADDHCGEFVDGSGAH